jgi:hypothetical protein
VRLTQRSDEPDEALWFPCVDHPGARDLLVPAIANPVLGRLPAWCPTREVRFRVSPSELPDDLPEATRYWVRGFLAGQLPELDDAADAEDLSLRRDQVDAFLTTGRWPLDPPSAGQ